MADQVDYYKVLGISRNASQSEIKNAYRQLAKERHPDQAGGSADKFALLQEAHAVLADPTRRRQHDEALDLAHAADQLAGLELDFGSAEDELSARRQQRESQSGPGLGERLRSRFGRKEQPDGGNNGRNQERNRARGRTRGRYRVESEARWYEPQDFDPDPITWKSGTISFLGALVIFLALGQIGLWATVPEEVDPGVLEGIALLSPLMPILYTLAGLVVAYFAFRAAGYAAVALVFVAGLIVGGQGGPEGLLQFITLGIIILFVMIWLGNRRDQAARR
ncbi:MAG: DnaJ domain-containing protein [Rubrobacteraceae bacterium]